MATRHVDTSAAPLAAVDEVEVLKLPLQLENIEEHPFGCLAPGGWESNPWEDMGDKIHIPLHKEMKDLLIHVVSPPRARRLRVVVLPPELPPMPDRPTPRFDEVDALRLPLKLEKIEEDPFGCLAPGGWESDPWEDMGDKIHIPLHTEMKDLLIPVVSPPRARRLRAVVLPPELPPMPERPTPRW